MLRIRLGHPGLLAGLAVGLWAFGGEAAAQFSAGPIQACGAGGCGPSGCAGLPSQGPAGKGPCSTCGQRMYPVFDNRYIRQFCKPTINPDSCFGHYKTQWTRWGQGCPNWGGDGYMTEAVGQPPLDRIPATRPDTIPQIGPSAKEPLPVPKAVPPTIEPSVPPIKDPPKVPPTLPPVTPKKAPTTGLEIPPVPVPNPGN